MCNNHRWNTVLVALLAIYGLGGLAPLLRAQETVDYFRQNCASCHTIGGGPLTGPDLKDVTKRKDREWLIQFLLNPKAVIDSGDPYAKQLVEASRGVVMPSIFGMTRDRAERLLDLIEAESKLPKSQFAGLQISDRPFTSEEVAAGREYFFGYRAFANGGPPCVSCHTTAQAGWLGGGRLGPDLTKVIERLQGRKALAAWLQSPATPTMLPLYKRHPLKSEEILPLVAYLENIAEARPENATVYQFNFFLLGLILAIVFLFLFEVVWKKRFRSVRRKLIAEATERKGLELQQYEASASKE